MEKAVNVRIDAELWRMFRVACLHHGITISCAIQTMLHSQLEKWNVPLLETEGMPPSPHFSFAAMRRRAQIDALLEAQHFSPMARSVLMLLLEKLKDQNECEKLFQSLHVGAPEGL